MKCETLINWRQSDFEVNSVGMRSLHLIIPLFSGGMVKLMVVNVLSWDLILMDHGDFVFLISPLFSGGMVKPMMVNVLSWDLILIDHDEFVLLVIPLFSGGRVKLMKIKMLPDILLLVGGSWVMG